MHFFRASAILVLDVVLLSAVSGLERSSFENTSILPGSAVPRAAAVTTPVERGSSTGPPSFGDLSSPAIGSPTVSGVTLTNTVSVRVTSPVVVAAGNVAGHRTGCIVGLVAP